MKILSVRGVYFDCFEEEEEIYWAEICTEILEHHPELKEFADTVGGLGCCGVFGCFHGYNGEDDTEIVYIDIPKKEAEVFDASTELLESYVAQHLIIESNGAIRSATFEGTEYMISMNEDEKPETQAARFIVKEILEKLEVSEKETDETEYSITAKELRDMMKLIENGYQLEDCTECGTLSVTMKKDSDVKTFEFPEC